MRSRGYTLIELMIAVAILTSGAALFGWMHNYQQATSRAVAVEGLNRVLEMELERARACTRRSCLEGMVTRTATTAGVSEAQNTWVRALVQRTIAEGPNQTVEVTISARAPVAGGRRSVQRQVSTLVWVRR